MVKRNHFVQTEKYSVVLLIAWYFFLQNMIVLYRLYRKDFSFTQVKLRRLEHYLNPEHCTAEIAKPQEIKLKRQQPFKKRKQSQIYELDKREHNTNNIRLSLFLSIRFWAKRDPQILNV